MYFQSVPPSYIAADTRWCGSVTVLSPNQGRSVLSPFLSPLLSPLLSPPVFYHHILSSVLSWSAVFITIFYHLFYHGRLFLSPSFITCFIMVGCFYHHLLSPVLSWSAVFITMFYHRFYHGRTVFNTIRFITKHTRWVSSCPVLPSRPVLPESHSVLPELWFSGKPLISNHVWSVRAMFCRLSANKLFSTVSELSCGSLGTNDVKNWWR